MKKTLILDTSLFVNPASSQVFGYSPTSAFASFLELAQRAAHVDYLMPPSIYQELMHFAEEAKIPHELRIVVQQRPPKKHETKIPGIFIYQLVEEMRDRVDRGLRTAERVVRETIQAAPKIAAPDSNPKKVRADAELISSLREAYRRIMREGMLDSRADVDLLLLAYETGGQLVSADQGVVSWAENLGIQILPYDHLKEFVEREIQNSSIRSPH